MEGTDRKRKIEDRSNDEILEQELNDDDSFEKIDTVKTQMDEKSFDGFTGLIFGMGDVGQLGLGEDILERKKPYIIPNIGKLKQISCGGMHTIALTVDNKVYTWGCNDDNALGRKTSENLEEQENVPCVVNLGANNVPIKVTSGDSHSAILTKSGKVLVCGIYRNSSGKIGLIREKVSEQKFTILYDSKKTKVSAIDIASGNDHIIILRADGKIYSCGSPEQGQLGRVRENIISENGGRRGWNTFFIPAPVNFSGYSRDKRRRGVIKTPFVAIYCGEYHSFAVNKNGDVYAWGLNNYGQLGFASLEDAHLEKDDDKDIHEIEEDSLKIYRPVYVGSISKHSNKENLVKIVGGQHHTIILDSTNNKVYSFGRADYGRLGIGKTDHSVFANLKYVSCEYLNNETPKFIGCGDCVSYIVTSEGNAYSFGMHSCSQLGVETEEDILVPTKITGKNLPDSEKVVFVGAGGQHTAMLTCSKN